MKFESQRTFNLTDNITVSVQWEYDQDGHPDWIGKLHHLEVAGAIPIQGPRNKYWFTPEITVSEHREGLVELGWDTKKAHRQGQKSVLQDAARMTNWLWDRWWLMGCVVEIKANGVSIGYASLWGIESDSDDSHFAETESTLIGDAKSGCVINLTSKIAKLQAALAEWNTANVANT